jgi:hypothetical protein
MDHDLLRDGGDGGWRRPISYGFTMLHYPRSCLENSTAAAGQARVDRTSKTKHSQTRVLGFPVAMIRSSGQAATRKIGKPHNVGHKWHNAHSTQQDMFATTI